MAGYEEPLGLRPTSTATRTATSVSAREWRAPTTREKCRKCALVDAVNAV